MDAAVDVGGTFTDFVVRRGERIEAFKRPSTPARPEEVLLQGLEDRKVDRVGHGTTVATNAILEGKGAPTALLTTAGFEDLLVIGRQHRPRLYDLRTTRPDPLIPRDLTFGVEERVDAQGEILVPLEEAAVAALADRLASLGVRSVAVSFLFSFLRPDHEEAVGRLLADRFDVSLSSTVLPEFREVERTSTTVLDARVGPAVRGYLERLRAQLPARLVVMRSNGGVRDAATLARRPVELLLSGPAGGVAGAAFLADALGLEEVMTLDMGGTSADVSLLHEGRPTWTTESEVGGHPLALPVLDIATVGAGGGSIAWRDAGGALRVGPRSAGAEPGPLCYGRGGAEPTLTDADLLSGFLGPSLLGGAMTLDPKAAEAGLAPLFEALGLDRDRGLLGVRRVVVSHMVRAAALAFARRGLDPRDFALLAFGGAGPMHALEVARQLEMDRVVVPPLAGAFSAYGILVSDVRLDAGRGLLRPYPEAGDEVRDALAALEGQARRDLEEQGVDPEEATYLPSVDLRYRGQSYDLNVPFGEAVLADFHRLHEARYGYAMEGEPVEAVTVRLTAVVRRPKPLPEVVAGPAEPRTTRRVLFEGGWTATPVYEGRPGPGFAAAGPLVVEEATATTVVDPAARARVDEVGALHIEVG